MQIKEGSVMSKDRVSPSRIGLALTFALLLLGVPTLSGATPTAAQCESEWEESPADDSCYQESFSVSPTGNCSVVARCQREIREMNNASFLIGIEYFDDLHNCDGTLQVGACS